VTTELRKAKHDIRAFIRMHWDDEKLAAVYAFNQDGKMDLHNACSCVLGVTLAATLHHERCGPLFTDMHYSVAKFLPGAREAEMGYVKFRSCCVEGRTVDEWPGIAQRRLSAILRAEMRRRSRVALQSMPELTHAHA
jgi:hypothetical protein